MKTNKARRAVGALVTTLAVAATCVGASQPDSGSSTVVGYFTDASPLDPGSQVRASGVQVGTVDSIQLDSGRAKVTMTLDRAVLPLHRDAKLTIKPVSLLGERFIDVDAGSPTQPYLSPAIVPVTQTSSAVTLQQVIDTFDDPTSTSLAVVLSSLGEGFRDAGPQAAQAISALAPAMIQTKSLGDLLRGQNQQLGELVDRVQPVADALASNDGKVLDDLVGSTQTTLSTLAVNQQGLDQTLAELPSTLTQARQTLQNLTGVAAPATPTLQSIRPITGNLDQISGELDQFADAADPALASLQPVLTHADALLREAAPVVANLAAAGPNLAGTAANLRPVGDQLLNQHLDDLMAFVRKWSLSTNGRDALGHYFRGVIHVTPNVAKDLVAGALAQFGPGKPAGAAPPPLVPNSGGLSQLLPGLLGNGAQPAGTPAGGDPGNATGLTETQEQSLLGQLLGGV
ncbi:MlaD family protein [Amycolatopsis methanolica]|uniref:Mammalian cell entry related domain protein n=1 Tax=Amycolatopsis methanolica 239 TaxID=1068978 RepID=A0A076MKB1_AMYME|nr:MlaD family protein [Amycolatopsis methanolica]AIJ21303.1 Mammalian cell entry related domain protein [Amycolatopsis methanolica 239]